MIEAPASKQVRGTLRREMRRWNGESILVQIEDKKISWAWIYRSQFDIMSTRSYGRELGQSPMHFAVVWWDVHNEGENAIFADVPFPTTNYNS